MIIAPPPMIQSYLFVRQDDELFEAQGICSRLPLSTLCRVLLAPSAGCNFYASSSLYRQGDHWRVSTPRKVHGLGPLGRMAVSLPPAWLRGGSLFLTALAGWSLSLTLTGHDPAFQPGWQVAGTLAVLGIRVPRWLHAARRARVQQHEELRRVRTLMATHRLPVLSRSDGARDGAGLRGTRALALLAAANLPLPVYEAEIGAPRRRQTNLGNRGRQGVRPICEAGTNQSTCSRVRASDGTIPHEHDGHLLAVVRGCGEEGEVAR